MRILVVSPGERPSVREICGDLASMQAVTGGPIQALYPFEAPVALVCHEEGKLLGLPLNRALYDEETGAVYDVIAGTFFLCGAPPEAEDFTSLTEEQLLRFSIRFARPEIFFLADGRLTVLREKGGA